MDLQEDLVHQKSVTPTPRHIFPVVHAMLQFAVDAAEEESKKRTKFRCLRVVPAVKRISLQRLVFPRVIFCDILPLIVLFPPFFESPD